MEKKYKRVEINSKPQDIDKDNWFYDGKTHLTFIHQVKDKEGKYIQTDDFKVSIKKLSNFIANLQ